MQKTQRKKISRDLWNDFDRTVMLVIGLFVGIFSVSLILNSFSVLKRESSRSYSDTNPASFSLWMNTEDEKLFDTLREDERIESVEARRMVRARIENENVDEESVEMYLYVVDDFDDVRINKFYGLESETVPAEGEILIENLSCDVADISLNDSIDVKIPLYPEKELKVSGIVTAPGLKPAWIEKTAYGFISKETFEEMGGSADFVQVLFTVADQKDDKEYIEQVAYDIKEFCQEEGYLINRSEVNEPGEHPNGKQIDSLMFLFEIFSVLTLILSGVLMYNLITVLMNNQKKQIGIMKAVGAKTGSIAKIYYSMVFRISIIASAFAIPMSYRGSIRLVKFCTEMLNVEVASYAVSHYLILIELAIGIIIPLIAASSSIRKYSSMSIQSCIRTEERDSKQKWKRISFLSRWKNLTLKMGLSNSVRNMKKLTVLVMVLAVGGASFIISNNLRDSLDKTVLIAEERIGYDLMIVASKNYSSEEIEDALEDVDGIDRLEYIPGGMAFYQKDDELQSNSFLMAGTPKESGLFDYPIMEGRMIQDYENEIVINQLFQDEHPDVKVGDELEITTNRRTATWKVVGVVKEIGGDEAVYADRDAYVRNYFEEEEPFVREIAVYMKDDVSDRTELGIEIERALSESGIDVQNTNSSEDIDSSFSNHLKLIAGFLMIVSFLVIAVGIISLRSFISVDVSERSSEIGVMMAIGGRHSDIERIFLWESGVVAILSLILSAIGALPLTYHISNSFGKVFLGAPLDWTYGGQGVIIWFVLITLGCIAVSFVTVKKFLKKGVSNALA